MAMSTRVATVNEMHQGAREQQRIRQGTEDVGRVLGEQIEGCHTDENQAGNAGARAPESALLGMLWLDCHVSLLRTCDNWHAIGTR
jgi:hypothetical protein